MARSVMTHQFSQVPRAEIPRSSFNRSHGIKTTFDSGQLIPILVDEALPGDTFTVRLSALARMATPIYPIMDNLFLETFFFAVPIRLVWDNWQRFNGEQTNPGDSTDFTVPVLADNNWQEGELGDYFGLPTGVITRGVNALPFRCHNLIWNEWFRDQNMQDSLTVNKDNGPDGGPGTYPVVSRGKRHDYFTSCLPWPQKGDSVDLPLGTSAPIASTLAASSSGLTVLAGVGGSARDMSSAGSDVLLDTTSIGTSPLIADLTNATAATINSLRQAFQIQKLLERDARGGTRYTEIIRAHFGVTSPDARLQRPEYLGGGSTRINVSQVPQTSATDVTTSPQGNLAAFATASVSGHGFSKSFTEHCYIFGFANVRADLTYQQGLERMWSRSTRYDFYWPALCMIGEQAVLNKEIYYNDDANDDLVFGYQERYAEYRYKPSRITGAFRSNAAASLDAWHLSQDFSVLPALNDAFITDKPPVDRVVAVPSEPQFIFDGYFDMRCARPMPLYGVPGLIDHF